MKTTKHVFSSGFALAIAVLPMATLAAEITVYKSAKCGCCKEWVEHMRQNGFEVTALDVGNLDEIKRKHAVPGHLASCHTSIVGGYVVEGHVPADAVKRLLSERPKVTGIAVPGMPMGSPGMEGDRKDSYEIMSFDPGGEAKVYERR
ncbi:MAG: DUF411 domain-containing protein [Gammaproteobacteria bacterium]